MSLEKGSSNNIDYYSYFRELMEVSYSFSVNEPWMDEPGLEQPPWFLDPTVWVGGIVGAYTNRIILFPRWQRGVRGYSDLIIRWPGGWKTRFDITYPHPHSLPHIHWWTKY